jgi:hypothetical protein
MEGLEQGGSGWTLEADCVIVIPYLMKKNVSTEKVALLMVWNIKFLSVTVRKILFSARRVMRAKEKGVVNVELSVKVRALRKCRSPGVSGN